LWKSWRGAAAKRSTDGHSLKPETPTAAELGVQERVFLSCIASGTDYVTGSTEWRIRYERRIKSVAWKNMRRDVMRLRGAKCERCERTIDLALHHKTYERLGRELLSDLELLCSNCHKRADVERSVRGQERSSAALYSARLNGWASKKYGEDWQDWADPDVISDEFDQWVERHADDEP
jgi:hypothetical protein